MYFWYKFFTYLFYPFAPIYLNFRKLKNGDVVNLEKSMKFGERVSGHYVQGHIDTISKIMKISFIGKSWFMNFKLLAR